MMSNLPSGYREPPSFDEYIEAKDRAKDEHIRFLSQKADQLESEFKDYRYCMEEMLSHMIDLYNAETTSHYSRLYLVGKLELSEKLREISNA
jgi:CII-binding regulator of phage lambda lysogenization HflD